VTAPARLTSRAERTRAAILETAEALFAERGFEATRLEDVAERVGIRRASIVYYFRDKRELYEAVLHDLFSDLLARVETALDAPGPLLERVDAAVGAWVETIGRRPSLPRLLLREVLDAADTQSCSHDRSALVPADRASEGAPVADSTGHVTSAIAGASLFQLTALPARAELGGEPSRRSASSASRQLLRLAHRLLGARPPRGLNEDGSRPYDPFEFNRAQGMGRSGPLPASRVRRAGRASSRSGAVGDQPRREHARGDLSSSPTGRGARPLDGETFSSKGYGTTMGLVMGRTILEMDEPEHSRYRGLLQKAFTKRALDHWERELVRPVVNGLIDRFAERGRADLVRELTFPFPVSVIAGMIGLDPRDHAEFHRLAIELISIAIDPLRGLRASQSLRELFARVLAERRREPRDDLMTVLAQAELQGTRLDDEAISPSCACSPRGPGTYRSSATCCSASSPTRTSSRRCARTARSCRRRSRKACAGRRRSRASCARRRVR
jgi:AcrR family transcriptional regulator